jgi:hypothetical protein
MKQPPPPLGYPGALGMLQKYSWRGPNETSFPYLRVARLLDVPYSMVLNYVTILELGGETFAPPIEPWHHATLAAFRREQKRRAVA